MNSCISITKSAIFSIATQLERKNQLSLSDSKKVCFLFWWWHNDNNNNDDDNDGDNNNNNDTNNDDDGGGMTTTMTTMTTTTTPTTMTTTKMTCLEADKDCLQAFKCFLSRKESWKSTQCWKKMLKSLSQYWTFGHGILRQGWSKSLPIPMKRRNSQQLIQSKASELSLRLMLIWITPTGLLAKFQTYN